jgi:nucleoside-diphosphate-sugar epimerase
MTQRALRSRNDSNRMQVTSNLPRPGTTPNCRDQPMHTARANHNLLVSNDLPARMTTVEELDEFLARPTAGLIDDLAHVDGDILILGVAGKMGPALARMARHAAPGKRIVGVARFSDPAVRRRLEGWGVETVVCDLLDRHAVEKLPRLKNVIFMAGKKFGTSADQPFSWAMNAYVPAVVAEVCAGSRIVAFSTLCVYPFADVRTAGWDEACPPEPCGEYANSCVGRERAIQYFTRNHGSSGRLVRLNYAIDLRYGVLHDLGQWIMAGQPIDLRMGYANIIWQGDATAQILRTLRHCTTPAAPLNIGNPANSSIRDLATLLGARLGKTPVFVNDEAPTAWINDTRQATELFGKPVVTVDRMLDWTADWLLRGMPSYGKPTRYEERNGRF